MDDNYFDFGVPLSFGYTAEYLPQKSVTRRDWKDSHASKFIKAFERAAADDKKLRVPAVDKAYHRGGKQIGWAILSHAPYREKLRDMPQIDLVAEGGMCTTVEEFAGKYFKGNLDKEVWVIGFRFQEINEQCLELSNSSVVLVVSDSDLNPSGDSNLIKPSKSAQEREQCTRITLPTLQSGTTCEPFAHPLDNSTASLVAAPAKTLADAEKSKDLTAIDLLSGGKCCESSMNANPLSSAGKMLRERCTEELEKLLPLSEWSDTKLRTQLLYRQRSLEPHISEKGFSLLPTATTYPSGNAKISSAGRNKLESTLRSLIPTPRANDGNQGYNSGKTGGINLTGHLLATPQNTNSPTLLGNLKGDLLATPSARDFKGYSPTKKKGTSATLSDNVHSFIQPTESANPQVWGWMMGFPKNWCESVLMPQIGLLESVDQDGGKKVRHKLLDCQENEFKGDEIQSTSTELLASPTKLSPSPSESDTCPILKTTLQVMTSDREPDRVDWLKRDLDEQMGIAESRLQELELDREVLPEDLYLRQRIEWQARLQAFQYTQEAIAKIRTRYTSEYEAIINRQHPQIEAEEGYTSDFAPKKWAESESETGILIRIENYRHTSIGWIAECNVRRSDRVKRGSTFLIKAAELFSDFHPWDGTKKEREVQLPVYSLGSIRTEKGLKSHFRGLKIPSGARPESTEVKAPDGSIWQACKDGVKERAAIKWRCEVLPDGYSRSPRIDNKKTADSTAAYQPANNINYSYEC